MARLPIQKRPQMPSLPIIRFIFGQVSQKEFQALSEVNKVRLYYQALASFLLALCIILTLFLAQATIL